MVSRSRRPSPDDLLYETLAGDDAHPAIPGYDPDISAELYTTNGDTDDHAHAKYGTLAFTPEMTTCETASAIDPDDAFDPADCDSGFNFPDSEVLIQAEFEKNLPFALSLARSAKDPDDPISAVGRTAPDFAVDSFTTSYGSPQPVAVTARRDLRKLRMHYTINRERTGTSTSSGGAAASAMARKGPSTTRSTAVSSVAPSRATRSASGSPAADRARASESVTRSPTRWPRTPSTRCWCWPTRTTKASIPNRPEQPGPARSTRRLCSALKAAGYPASVWDVSKQGVPHDLGVLAHFKAVVWYLGDNRLTQDPEDEPTLTSATPT